MDKKYYEANTAVLFTRCHILDYLDRNEKARVMDLVREFGQHDFKIHKQLQRLMADGFVKRHKEKYKNHLVYHYSLTPYADTYKRKNGLMSYMEKINPMYGRLQKIAARYTETTRHKAGKETVIVPRKELVGFR